MFYIARIPPTENPKNPGFYEFLAGGEKVPYWWTASPSEALRFHSEGLASLSLAHAPEKIKAGAFIKNGPRLADFHSQPNASVEVESLEDEAEKSIHKYKNRRTRN